MQYPALSAVEAALSVLHEANDSDTHLVYTSRLCLRNLLRDNAVIKQVITGEWTREDAAYIAGVMVDVPSAEAAVFLSRYLETHAMPKEKIPLAYQHITRFVPAAKLDEVLKNAMQKKESDIVLKSLIFKGIREGMAQRGGKANEQLFGKWGSEIAESLFNRYPPGDTSKSEETVSLQKFAIELAGDYDVRTLQPVLKAFLAGATTNKDVRVSALRSLIKITSENTALSASIVMDDSANSAFRKKVIGVLGEFPGAAANKVLAEWKVPPDLQNDVALALAASAEGKEIVFRQIRKGALGARTLMDPKVEERILLNSSPAQQREFADLTANLEPIDKERQVLIDVRLKEFRNFRASSIQLDSGQEVFSRNCVACHRRVNSTGIGIGPQLHGIGKRGADALAEKILDPNRNISEAFRSYTIKLKDGKVMTGLYRRDEGEVIVFADLTGKEFSVPKKKIKEQKPSRFTIMPDNFGTTLSQEEFNALLAYLLNS
jgi:putative heme-binding domain-containing protein